MVVGRLVAADSRGAGMPATATTTAMLTEVPGLVSSSGLPHAYALFFVGQET